MVIGTVIDPGMNEEVKVTVVATGLGDAKHLVWLLITAPGNPFQWTYRL